MTDQTESGNRESPSTLTPYRIPRATYRLQLNREFTFCDARGLVDYLQELGISDCYVSPISAARPGSEHGYDVCDFTTLNPELGTREEFNQWTDELRRRGLGLLLDVVPNHMAADPANPWWRDVLENGPNSPYALWFDIDWDCPCPQLKGRLLLPILGDHYFKELEAGKLQVVLEPDGFALAYYQNKLPLSPASRAYFEEAISTLCPRDARIEGFLSKLNQVSRETCLVPERGNIRRTTAEAAEWNKHEIEEQAAVEKALCRFNGEAGVPSSFNGLNALLQQQYYRLAFWRLGEQQINYRRFFDVSSLVSMRMELREVFEAAHGLTLALIREGRVTGLRIDHIDGLWNPKEYLDRLQQGGLYVVAEKILVNDEELPADWRVAGTTGYDFLNQLNGLFINATNEGALDTIYRQITSMERSFRQAAYAGKKRILQSSMRGDLHAVALKLKSIASQTRYGVDYGLDELQDALTAIIAAFPVYRTYLTQESGAPTAAERSQIRNALEAPEVKHEIVDPDVLTFIGQLLLLSPPSDLDASGRELCRDFVIRFQQLTGPVMAKGVEDTAFYNFNRFISLNEVGGDPSRFGTSIVAFHEQNQRRAERFPHSLLATSTHDTKRGEDLRARLNVLSEMPEEWGKAVQKWRAHNARLKSEVDGQPAPDANDEYLFYQTLVGAWETGAETEKGRGAFRNRISSYMLKAIRESKARTTWTEPNRVYEEATQRFIDALLSDSRDNSFLDDFMLFQRKVAFFGLFNSLAQVVLKLTAPGVPDLYQGSELWDYRLVDPDNRESVDYQRRQKMLFDMRRQLGKGGVDLAGYIKGLLQNHQNGQIKMYLVWKLLGLRARHQTLFESGAYVPIEVVGAKKDHLCAFARRSSNDGVIAIATRLISTLAQGAQRGALEPEIWQDTSLVLAPEESGGTYRDVLTEQVITLRPDRVRLAARDLLGLLPVSVLERVR